MIRRCGWALEGEHGQGLLKKFGVRGELKGKVHVGLKHGKVNKIFEEEIESTQQLGIKPREKTFKKRGKSLREKGETKGQVRQKT